MTHEEHREAVAVLTDILTNWWQRHVGTAAVTPPAPELPNQADTTSTADAEL